VAGIATVHVGAWLIWCQAKTFPPLLAAPHRALARRCTSAGVGRSVVIFGTTKNLELAKSQMRRWSETRCSTSSIRQSPQLSPIWRSAPTNIKHCIMIFVNLFVCCSQPPTALIPSSLTNASSGVSQSILLCGRLCRAPEYDVQCHG
jgi:hypothetical protein